MKKNRKHIALSTLLAVFVLSAQVAFFPLHYYFTHHNAIQHTTGLEDDLAFSYQEEGIPLSKSVEDDGCYWCDLFAHQGYFIEKKPEFASLTADITKVQVYTFAFLPLKADLPVSRGPPAC